MIKRLLIALAVMVLASVAISATDDDDKKQKKGKPAISAREHQKEGKVAATAREHQKQTEKQRKKASKKADFQLRRGQKSAGKRDISARLNARDTLIFRSFIKEAGMENELNSRDKLYLLVPADQYFSRMSRNDLAALRADRGRLRNMVASHVTNVPIDAYSFERRIDAKGTRGPNRPPRKILKTIKTDNGVIYVIDRPLNR